MHRHITVAALTLFSIALPACGGGGSGAKNEEAKFQEAALKHAKCMRDNGIDFPDPTFSEGGARVRVPEGVNREKMRQAEEKCRHFIEDALPEITPEQRDEIAKRALAHARCMREQGIDMPDPVVTSKGGIQMRGPERGDKPSGPQFDRAEEKCRKAGGDAPKLKGRG
jgi:hypothetical protein